MENFLNPNEILAKLDLQKSQVAADFGCGSGGWAIPLAHILSEGKVYAIDLIKGPLSALESRAKMEQLMNVQTIVANVEKGVKIASDSCDLVLMTNVLFQCENRKSVLEDGKRILKEGGKILFVDWKKSANFGPRERAIAPEEVKAIASEIGMAVDKEFEAGIYHYGLVLVK
jgi:ubiquinone/menaquinone biosynthesis C-methylase UbiE